MAILSLPESVAGLPFAPPIRGDTQSNFFAFFDLFELFNFFDFFDFFKLMNTPGDPVAVEMRADNCKLLIFDLVLVPICVGLLAGRT